MPDRSFIVLTGGPGGGKTTLIKELQHDSEWADRFVALPEAISVIGQTGISPCERLFQRLMVEIQAAMEEGINRALGPGDTRIILCHRGTLDPLAYWLARGWSKEEFFTFTNTQIEEHYRRYLAVLHLVTTADGAPDHYEQWPHSHRPESRSEAIHLDRLLQQSWGGHSRYFLIDNEGKDWSAKAKAAKNILTSLVP